MQKRLSMLQNLRLHTAEVAGSNPAEPIAFGAHFADLITFYLGYLTPA